MKSADYWNGVFSVTKSIKERIEAAGLSIPYPQRDVHHQQAAGDPIPIDGGSAAA